MNDFDDAIEAEKRHALRIYRFHPLPPAKENSLLLPGVRLACASAALLGCVLALLSWQVERPPVSAAAVARVLAATSPARVQVVTSNSDLTWTVQRALVRAELAGYSKRDLNLVVSEALANTLSVPTS